MLKEILLEGDEIILGIRGEYIGNNLFNSLNLTR